MPNLTDAATETVNTLLLPTDPYGTRVLPSFKAKTTEKLPRRASARQCCETCGDGTQMVSAEKAAAVGWASRRQIYRWIEDGSLHFLEQPDGEVLICGRTLAAKLE